MKTDENKANKNGQTDMEDKRKDEEEEEGEEKSLLTEDELKKSLDALESIANDQGQGTRKQALLKKALESQLSTEENTELMGLMGQKETSLAKSASEDLDDDDIRKAIDVSPYLEKMHSGLEKSLEKLSTYIEKDSIRQHEFNVVMAKAVVTSGKLNLELKKALDEVLSRPVAPPKAAGLAGAKPLVKSFGGTAQTDQLSKSQVMFALRGMQEEAMQKGDSVRSSAINHQIIKYENTPQVPLDPQLEAEIRQRVRS